MFQEQENHILYKSEEHINSKNTRDVSQLKQCCSSYMATNVAFVPTLIVSDCVCDVRDETETLNSES